MTESVPTTGVVVSHTHWDRAWYMPFQVFRMRLVRLIDRLLELYDRDPEFRSFLLDGQMLPVEDYLEVRPERRADLERLVRAGRLFVGPWYALADEYLVSPEALVRNLLLGTRLAEQMGGANPGPGANPVPGAMREGYVPDAFGHIAQLPQILRGFGIRSALFARGMGDEGEALGDQFWWEAPDGTRVLAVHLRQSYGNAATLGYWLKGGDISAVEFDLDLAVEDLRQATALAAEHSHARSLLLLNGTDHTEAQPELPQILDAAKARVPGVHFEHGDLPGYVRRVLEEAGERLPTFRGEFNRGRYNNHLQGVYSSRVYLNQANERAQTLLECYAEPLATWAWLLGGGGYPRAFLDLAWRMLLQNHPHDDICGCSTDVVHRENVLRFEQVMQVGTVLARDAFRALAHHVDRTAQPGTPFLIYNPVPWLRSEVAEVDLFFEHDDPLSADLNLATADGRSMACQILEEERLTRLEVGKVERLCRVRAAVQLDVLPAGGYRVYYALPGTPADPPEPADPVQLLPNGMENRHVRVEIGPDGTLDLFHKAAGRRYSGLGALVDEEDAGDEYDYSPCPNPATISTRGQPAAVRLIEAGPLQAAYEIAHELLLPEALAPDRQQRSANRVACLVTTRVTLRSGSARVDLRTTVDNRARDHRLRVLLPAGIETAVAAAHGHWDVVERAVDLPAGEGWIQPPSSTAHQRYFVDLSDGAAGLAVLNRGLAEYEAVREREGVTLALTLLRCVGHLSRGDLLTRRGHAGPPLPTPEAQCPGVHVFEYALLPHVADWRTVYREACAWRAPVAVMRGTEIEGWLPAAADLAEWEMERGRIRPVDLAGDLPGQASFLALEPAPLALSAVKQSEDGQGVVVRFYNPSPEPLHGTLSFSWPVREAWQVTLEEKVVGQVEVDAGRVCLQVGGNEVRTIKLLR
ncbi:MAG TPA: glycoside hydrolase family 38 C-terminal domain-containing protein [Anaerolineae bacterium]|nr:glycoside hydrolase family 38 C-terminal domain-containing protein [Anaerolineae bacterium]